MLTLFVSNTPLVTLYVEGHCFANQIAIDNAQHKFNN